MSKIDPQNMDSTEYYALDRMLTFITAEVRREVLTAMSMYDPYNSAHEGFAIINEEFDELKEHVWCKQSKRDLEKMRKEAIQVAATAIRFVFDVCNEEVGRK